MPEETRTPPSIETGPPDAQAAELASLKKEAVREIGKEMPRETVGASTPPLPTAPPPPQLRAPTQAKDPARTRIEHTLEDNLGDLFVKMPDPLKARFKAKGEETAAEIQTLLKQTTIKVKKLFALIVEWLRMIPGINKFFLEQEAKIKADTIVAHEMEERTRRQRGLTLALLPQFAIPAGGIELAVGTPAPTDTLLLNAALGLVALVAFFIVAVVARRILRIWHEVHPSSQHVLLLVTVPKEQQLKEKEGPQTIDAVRAKIAIAESFFAALGGLKPEKGLHAWFFGRQDHFSFEIVALHGRIHFYIATPRRYRELLEQQLLAQYPFAAIEEVEDYNIFSPTGAIAGGYLVFQKENAFPFKTYKALDADPLNGLTNPLSKLTSDQGAAIQIVARSAKKEWRKPGLTRAKDLVKGPKKGGDGGWSAVVREQIAGGSKKEGAGGQAEPYRLSPMEEQMVKGIEEKASKAGFDMNIRVVVSDKNPHATESLFKSVMGAFSQFNLYQYGNSFKGQVPSRPAGVVRDFIHRQFNERRAGVVNVEELSSLWHLPLPSSETPGIVWLTSRTAPPPQNMPAEGIVLGKNVYRGVETMARIKRDDRRRHAYIIGQTGVGKSWLLANMARQDIVAGEGVCIIDPHGDFIEDVLGAVPPHRIDDVILFEPADVERPMGLNLLEYDEKYPEQKTFVINEMIKIMDKLYDLRQTGGPLFEQYMRNAMLLIMDDPATGSTLMEINKVLADADFRKMKYTKCTNPVVVDFWTKEAEKAGGEAALQNMVPYITSKLNQFVANDIMRPIIGQQQSAFNFREVMDKRKILLVNLSKGKLGDINAYLLGMVLVGKILMASLSRTDIPQDERPDFYLYIDEFQNFITDSIATILSEARKYRLNLTVAHQYIGQLVQGNDAKIRDAVFGNVGTKILFRIGVEDAEFLAKEFAPTFNEFDLINIEKFTAYIKLLIDNTAAKPFNMQTIPLTKGNKDVADAIRQLSRLKYGRDRMLVEEEIRERQNTAV